tara:strand:+ start:2384 stop:2617 length:234 start_codon:yes stop_codon:yes gene_type:complete
MTNYKNIIVYNVEGTAVLSDKTAEAVLKATDWTQLTDSGLTSECVAAFATYRASIRTIRRTNPSSPTWPTVPTEEWS